MSKTRRLMVYAIMFVLVAGHAASVATDRDPWPFSNYPMYARAYPPHWEDLELVGVPRDDPQREIVLDRWDLPRPISMQVGLSALKYRIDAGLREEAELEEMLEGIAGMYERRRAAGLIDIEPLEAVRMYWVTRHIHRTPTGVEVEEVDRQLRMEVATPGGDV